MTTADSLTRESWLKAERELDEFGNAPLRGLLTPEQCRELSSLYSRDDGYRTRIVMARHGFGRGEYKYFSYPLPPLIEELRHVLYLRLVPIANRWNRLLKIDVEYPPTLGEFLERCHQAGQKRPTPLILEYSEGDYNCLHQDLYGDHVFPLQVALLLSEPGRDFTGGEFVMTESGHDNPKASVVSLGQGDGVVFTTNQRPAAGKRGGTKKVAMRHGVSKLRSGKRHTVGIIFHDSR